ncbi:MAG: hypothetical protein E6R03_12895 [Hyphomicrobiaceae bacterium]|nr:MAG: hypothetical protein E6R03_12895 [Hyphomicrobiaceae bacterium]
MNRHGKSIVYVVSALGGPIKVGIATDVWVRVWQLQTGNHLPLTLEVVCYPEGRSAKQVELAVHQEFHARCIRGEWFSLSVEEAVAFLEKFGRVTKPPPFVESAGYLRRSRQATDEEVLVAIQAHPRWGRKR